MVSNVRNIKLNDFTDDRLSFTMGTTRRWPAASSGVAVGAVGGVLTLGGLRSVVQGDGAAGAVLAGTGAMCMGLGYYTAKHMSVRYKWSFDKPTNGVYKRNTYFWEAPALSELGERVCNISELQEPATSYKKHTLTTFTNHFSQSGRHTGTSKKTETFADIYLQTKAGMEFNLDDFKNYYPRSTSYFVNDFVMVDWTKVKATQLNLEEEDIANKLFSRIDTNHNGVLDKAEVGVFSAALPRGEAMKSVYPWFFPSTQGTQSMANHLDILDDNGDGGLQRDEFEKLCKLFKYKATTAGGEVAPFMKVWHKSLGRVLREKKENHEWWAEKLAYGFGGIGGLFIAGGAVQCATQEKKDPSGIVLGGVSAAIGGFYWMDLKKSQARTEDWASEY